VIALDSTLPLLALASGVTGLVLSSVTLMAVAVLLATIAVARGVAKLSPPDLWKEARRRRHRSR
jgi:hypothetical protein